MKYFRVIDCDWFCEECKDLLNNQEDFDFGCGTWKCKKCGHNNLIDEDSISNNFESKFEIGDKVKLNYKDQSGKVIDIHRNNGEFSYDVSFSYNKPSKPIEFFEPDEDDLIHEEEILNCSETDLELA